MEKEKASILAKALGFAAGVGLVSGPYSSFMGLKASKPREIGGMYVRARETCPVCGRTNVNIYHDGSRWRCKRCIDEDRGDADEQ